ncbi:MAG: hypothetical protein EG823_02290 [Actinobacteria bacterium]|nr:hypothetical protein [Actinomycetota bacterium]
MNLDTGFRPSVHGFGFANTWRDTLLGVVQSRGRCGGMVFAALDAFAADTSLPPGSSARDLPSYDSTLARAIARRQWESVGVRRGKNLARFVRYTYLPSAGPLGIGTATRRELLRLFDGLRAGWPVPLGMVSALGLPHIATNHQVLAYAADFGEKRVTVRVYDPNHPRRDDVTLDVPLDAGEPVVEHWGNRVRVWRGFFIESYVPKSPAGGRA